MQIIGTAGHVDHGKSTLIEALTGIHPDRLREEREREMTIVLGFAWLTLPNGDEIGIVDVPGHRDFIENMLSGIGGIDAALFVIAADEGVMPQTREHLAILDLLQIQTGVVAISKIDLIDDSEWLELIETDVLDVLQGTVLESAPIIRVSAKTGGGLDELKETLSEVLAKKSHRPDLGRPRLSVDRAFTMPGFGTVVTGTLQDGHINVGDEIVILPQQIKGRVRGLQTHKHKTQIAVPGSRTAINISGIDVGQVKRGDVITYFGYYKPTRRLDVHFKLLADVSSPLKHNTEVKIFIGASEVIGRVRLLGMEILKPGESAWLQLELTSPIVAIRGDRYIIRRPSPGETLGGGIVVDPQPKGRHKRFSPKIISKLEAIASGTPDEILLESITSLGIPSINDAIRRSSLEYETAKGALQKLVNQGLVIFLAPNGRSDDRNVLIISIQFWQQMRTQIGKEIDRYLKSYPLRLGMPREELKSKLNLSSQIFNLAIQRMVDEKEIVVPSIRGNLPGSSPVPVITRPDWEIQLTESQQQQISVLLNQFMENPTSPPTTKECINSIGESLFNTLIDTGRIIPVSGEVVFRKEDYQEMEVQLRNLIKEHGSVSVAQVRDQFNTSRRYVLAFLEHLDSIGITVRRGDVREIK